MTQSCPACGGRGAVANAQTGNPMKCPVCQGVGQISGSLTDQLFWYLFSPAQLAGNAVGILSTITIDGDADFQVRWLVPSSTGLFSVEIKDLYHAGAPCIPIPITEALFPPPPTFPSVFPYHSSFSHF